MLQLDTINISSQTVDFLLNFCLSFMNDIKKHIQLPAETPQRYSNCKKTLPGCEQVLINAAPLMNTLSLLENKLLRRHTYSCEPFRRVCWYKQQGKQETSSKFLTDIGFKRASEERDRHANQRRDKRKQDNKWVLALEKAHTVPTFTSSRFVTYFSIRLMDVELMNEGHYLNALMCFVWRIQKCNIMSDKLPHYLSEWNKRWHLSEM